MVGRTSDGRFQAGKRRTVAIDAVALWRWVVSADGQAALACAPEVLTADSPGVTTFVDGSHYRRRISGAGGGHVLQVRVIAGSDGRATLALHAEQLADEAARAAALDRFAHALTKASGAPP